MACVTTGPGGTNAITGVLGQWHDSVPGPLRLRAGALRHDGGEHAACRCASSATRRPTSSAWSRRSPSTPSSSPTRRPCATTSRRPSGWPRTAVRARCGSTCRSNVQAAEVDPDELAGFDPAELERSGADWPPARPRPGADEAAGAQPRLRALAAGARRPRRRPARTRGRFDRGAARTPRAETLRRLRAAERPVILAGSAVRTAGALRRCSCGSSTRSACRCAPPGTPSTCSGRTTRCTPGGPGASATAPATSPCRTPTSLLSPRAAD